MNEAVIVAYARTAQTRARPNDPSRDWFGQVRADTLAAQVANEVVERAGIDAKEIDNCITGSAMGVNEQWTYGGRMPVFLANLPETIAARFVDQQCGSGLAAVQIAAMEIMTGYSDIVMCLGMEHMTRVPMNLAATGSDAIVPNFDLMSEAPLTRGPKEKYRQESRARASRGVEVRHHGDSFRQPFDPFGIFPTWGTGFASPRFRGFAFSWSGQSAQCHVYLGRVTRVTLPSFRGCRRRCVG